MSLLDYLSKENRLIRKIERNVKRANNKHTPKDYRQAALYEVITLAKKGEELAIQGLISRFSVNAEPSIEDEKEKEWVSEALIDMGEIGLAGLKKALRSAESVNQVQRVLRNVLSHDEYRDELLDVLSDFDTEYERNPDRKIQTIMALAEINEEPVTSALIRFLDDVDETVRYQTVVALFSHENEIAREPLLKTMCEDDSLRVRNEAMEGFANLGWSTASYKKKVDAVLNSEYVHEKSGKIVKKKKINIVKKLVDINAK
ncbi:MAG: HEAT repeat domain-containing protein [Deltaproteobacteria bacterium]|nr:HEAT repeat domain-containing protein [Deltaproteobacteria bacterium]